MMVSQIERSNAFSVQSYGCGSLQPSSNHHHSEQVGRSASLLRMASEINTNEPQEDDVESLNEKDSSPEWLSELKDTSPVFQLLKNENERKMPPLLVEDTNVLLYDIFLLVNLSASISFWVTHRMDFQYIGSAISEGSLLSILWIIAGLYNGAFLYSAVDGHYSVGDEKAGPRAAGMLGLHTFINTATMRVIIALGTALVEHRQVGAVAGEDLLPLEIAGGLLLMSLWRMLHSSYTPRI